MEPKFNDRSNDNLAYFLNKARENTEEAKRKAELEATTDSLTKVGNLRALDKTLSEGIRKLQSSEHKPGTDPDYFVFLLFDLNRLKFLNDTYGHPKGNEALNRAVQQFKQEVEARGGKIFRIGGDEFAVVQEGRGSLPQKPEEIARKIEDHINPGLFIETIDGRFDFSVSVGCATISKGEYKTIDELKKEADAMMYANKNARGTERGK
ncbi:MAG: GGDEF domain-containing protein [Patescibacteria group bacterium]